MTRLTVAGTPDAIATATSEKTRLVRSSAQVRYMVSVPGQKFRVFLTESGNDQITDLLDVAGAAITKVTADDLGQLPATRLPDGLVVDGVWFDPDDSSSARFFVPVRFGPATATALIGGLVGGVIDGGEVA